jgi:photosystem II stability/assembly factor-like uncharacterized protein
MKHRSYLNAFIFFICVCLTQQIYAQRFLELMNDPDADFYEVQRLAEEHFKKYGTEKGNGYKAYKRWEYEQQLSMTASGKVQTARQVWDEHQKMLAARPKGSGARVGNVYTELGPHKYNVTAHYAPGMGRVTYIALDPQNAQVIYTSGVGGVWKSIDGGASWKPLTDHLPAVYSNSVQVHPTNANLVLIGIDGLGILKSTDGGLTWNTTNLTNGNPKKIIFNPANPSIVLVASTNGIFRSIDAGNTFTSVQAGGFNDLDFKPGDPNTVYACGNTFYRSTNNGTSFTQITAGLPTSGRSFLAVSAANTNYVYIVQAKGSELGYVYRSTNSGVSFETRLAANPANGTNYFGYNPSEGGGQAGYDMAITASPTNAETIIIGGINLWKSTTGGSAYTQVTEWTWNNPIGYVHPDMHALEWIGGVIYSGSDGGLFRSINNGDDWTVICFGMGNREFYRIGGIESDPYYIGGGSQDNGQSLLIRKGVNEWRDWAGADGMEVVIDYNNKNNIYACLQNGGLWKSTNGGMSRTGINTPPGGGGNWVSPLFIDPVNPSTIYIGYKDVWKSTNGGSSWVQISSFGTSSGLEAATIAPSNNQYLYAADGGTMWVTKNGGGSWTNITAGLSGGINYISVHPTNANKVTAITNSGVFKSDNAGTNWTNVTYNLPNIGKRCVLYQKSPEDIIYVGLSVGVYYLKPGTTTWVAYFDGLPNVPVSELEINYSIGMLRVATSGRGLWEAPIIKNGVSNLAPTASITAPALNASFTAPANVTVNATASDADGTISKVEFFNGSTLIGTDLTSPYSFVWSNVAAGTYSLTVKATDNAGATGTSTIVTIFVNAPPCTVSGARLNSSVVIGTTGSWSNLGNDRSKVFDSDSNTFFDATEPDGAWAGLDLGRNAVVSGIRYYPRQGFESRMVGGKIQGSNVADFSAGVVDLLTIAAIPELKFNCASISVAGNFRYLRYLSPVGGHCNVSEIQFYGSFVNTPPSVVLTAPLNNASFVAPASVALAANASDADGTISKVEFFNGTTLIGSDLSSPYTFSWTNIAAGTYSITAKATDNSGAVGSSVAVAVVVNSPSNLPPAVSLTAPVNNATFTAPASISLAANASDADGTISKVEFFNGATLLGSDLTAPYAFNWINVAAGTYSITAKATDNAGSSTTSSVVTVSVTTPVNVPPTVSIAAPLNNASFTAPAAISISANASDADGTISKVEFFNGATLLGSDLTAPYGFVWSGVVAGNYTITAKATDNAGAVATSASIAVVVTNPVNVPPVVSITAPLNNASFTAPATVAIAANASDANGTISKVEFFNGAILLGTDLIAPYSFSWANVAAGTYSINAKATDNAGASTISVAILITVVPDNPVVIGVNGPSCVTAGQTIVYTVTTDPTQTTTINWWSNSGATTTIDPANSKRVSVLIPSYMDGTTFSLYAGVNFPSAPWYKEYSKSIKVGGCSASPAPVAVAPQPFDQKTTVSVENSKIVSLKVVDSRGLVVLSANNVMQENYELGEELSAGVYTVYIIAEDGEHVTKLVKLK